MRSLNIFSAIYDPLLWVAGAPGCGGGICWRKRAAGSSNWGPGQASTSALPGVDELVLTGGGPMVARLKRRVWRSRRTAWCPRPRPPFEDDSFDGRLLVLCTVDRGRDREIARSCARAATSLPRARPFRR
jgi:hypothetical protein